MIPRSNRFLWSTAFVALAVATLSSTVQAEERREGLYLGLGAGANIANDTDISGTGLNTDIDHDTGIAGLMSIGYGFADGLRAEFESGYRRNANNGGGAARVVSAMFNGYYDFSTNTRWTPYIGAGIGMGSLKLDRNPVGASSVSDRKTDLAMQGIAGIGYQFDYNWSGGLEYRYFTMPDVNMRAASGAGVDVDYGAHTVMVGLRYTFGEKPKPVAEPVPAPQPVAQQQPEPAPAPPPPSPVTRNFIVFFDWDSSSISAEAREVLRTAAANARRGGISRIDATGHADRSGTQAYNLALSERRAQAVQAELVRLGLSSEDIGLAWKGELEQLVPTEDGVREPQNRRVEIRFPN